jgi:hypothetical protein
MKRILISLFAVFISFAFVLPDAEARRMGGSKSFGMQRTAPAKQDTTTTAQPKQQSTAAPTTAPQKRSWMGPIAGLAAGLGLAALFSHLGLGEEMASFLMLALLAMAAFMLFRFFMRRNAPAPAMQYAGMPSAATNPAPPPHLTQAPLHRVAPALLRPSRPDSTPTPSRAKPSSTSSACRPRSTPPTWTTCAPSPRPRCTPKSACSWQSVATPPRSPT